VTYPRDYRGKGTLELFPKGALGPVYASSPSPVVAEFFRRCLWTPSQQDSMPPSASSLLELRDRRDHMVLTMAIDAARIKTRSREARHKKARQAGYRRVRYQRFQGRRGDAMEEEVREAVRESRKKSIKIMEKWLEAQGRSVGRAKKPKNREIV